MRSVLSSILALIVGVLADAALPESASATENKVTTSKLQQLRSRSGVPVWLVEDKSLPLISMSFGCNCGASNDPVGKEGLTSLTLELLDNGTAELDATAFREQITSLAAEFSVSASRDKVFGQVRSLKRHFRAVTKLVAQALQNPAFAPEEVDKARQERITDIAFEARDPATIARLKLVSGLFGKTPFARSAQGTAQSISMITRDDLVAHHRDLIKRDRWHVVIVGDLSPNEAVGTVDRIFSAFGAGDDTAKSFREKRTPLATNAQQIEFDGPRTTVFFALPVPPVSTDNTMLKMHAAILIANHVLGSGNFDSRLMTSLRVKRGLTYSIASRVQHIGQHGVLLGTYSTKAEDAQTAMQLMKSEFDQLAATGVSDAELRNAKATLISSYLLGLDSSARLSSRLLRDALAGLSARFLEQRAAAIRSVTASDVAIVARRTLTSKHLSIVTVGPSD